MVDFPVFYPPSYRLSISLLLLSLFMGVLRQQKSCSFFILYFLSPASSNFYAIHRLDAMGALRLRYLTSDHQLWRAFTSPCLHAGVFHLIISLSSVIFVGVHLEQEFGPCISPAQFLIFSVFIKDGIITKDTLRFVLITKIPTYLRNLSIPSRYLLFQDGVVC